MNRLDTRLRKIEMLAGGDDQAAEYITLFDAERLTAMRASSRAILCSPVAFSAEISSAHDKVAQLERLVWERVHVLRSPETLAAETAEVLEGTVAGCTWHWRIDCEALAREWGLIDANGALGPCPASPAKARFRFIDLLIVSPPPRAADPAMISEMTH